MIALHQKQRQKQLAALQRSEESLVPVTINVWPLCSIAQMQQQLRRAAHACCSRKMLLKNSLTTLRVADDENSGASRRQLLLQDAEGKWEAASGSATYTENDAMWARRQLQVLHLLGGFRTTQARCR